MNLKDLVKNIVRVIKNPEIIEDYESKITSNKIENQNLEKNLEKIEKRFSDYKANIEIEEDEKLYEIKDLNRKISRYKKLDEELTRIFSKIPIKIEDLSAKEMYERYKMFDKEGWAIYGACKELIDMNFDREYIIEDTMGWFENSDGHELRYYRELYKFGDINYKWVNDFTDSRNAEIVDIKKSSIDYNSEKYKEYEKELYSKALVNLKEEILKYKQYKRLGFIERTIFKDEIENIEEIYCNTDEEEYEFEI